MTSLEKAQLTTSFWPSETGLDIKIPLTLILTLKFIKKLKRDLELLCIKLFIY